MKKRLWLLSFLASCSMTAHATNLVDVFQDAVVSDPTYLNTIETQLSAKQALPISVAQVLPNISLDFDPSVTRQGFSGSSVGLSPRNNTRRAYGLTLSVTQTVFNFSQFANIASSSAAAKSAEASINAALQDLMVRVSNAYLAILHDEDNLSYSKASKIAYKEQLDQVQEQYDVGLKTITDVYTAKASYDSAVANYIASETQLANDNENLRVITGKYYKSLDKLSEDFPLVTPKPKNIEKWTQTTVAQNWSIRAANYTVDSARNTLRSEYGGHLPTVTLQGTLDKQYTQNINRYGTTIGQRNGPSKQSDRSITLDFSLPIFSGGGVVAATTQASHNLKAAQQTLELTTRTAINTTRQSYLGITSGISQIKADKQAVKSSQSSLEGMEASYKVGTTTLVDVLDQQQKLLQAQTQYAADRYSFVSDVLALKQAAGTLGFDDISAINRWLVKPSKKVSKKFRRTAKKTKHNKARKKVMSAKSYREHLA